MLDNLSHSALAGQLCGLVALVICVVAFASKSDDRLLMLLISAGDCADCVGPSLYGE